MLSNLDQLSFDLNTLHLLYSSGALSPQELVCTVYKRVAAARDNPIWITLVPQEELLQQAAFLEKRRREFGLATMPLYGVPFAVKDNIDVAGLPTTAACPAFAYTPKRSAVVVERLQAAGALLVGKTNLDQFATGLNGSRSPYGACRSAFSAEHIAGGSSSGSAVAVALGQVTFALGTDTAGSGRVPAAFNNIVGLKPTRGLISATGVVPACRSLDCVSIFAGTVEDAAQVLRVADVYDPLDPYARGVRQPQTLPAGFRFGVPTAAERVFYGNTEYAGLFESAVSRLRSLGGVAVEIDYAPFREAAELLYGGPWVAERFNALRDFLPDHSQDLLPVLRDIIGPGEKISAADLFTGQYRLEQLKQRAAREWQKMDVLVLPTTTTQYTLAEIAAEPLERNNHLGQYTNFVNLMDLAALAVPAGFTSAKLPFGITLIGPALTDHALARLGAQFHRSQELPLGALARPLPPAATPYPTPHPETTRVAVVGAHLSGMPLNWQLTHRGGRLLRATRTDRQYRLYALPGTVPPKPGLVRTSDGAHIDVEVWEVPTALFGSFVTDIPSPLGIGTLTLEDGEKVHGFLCESYALAGADDITCYGGWRAYMAR